MSGLDILLQAKTYREALQRASSFLSAKQAKERNQTRTGGQTRTEAQTCTGGQTCTEGQMRTEGQTPSDGQTRTGGRTNADERVYDGQANPQIARWLLMHLLNVDQNELISVLDKPISTEHKRSYTHWIERVLSGEPYQYIVGSEEFFGRPFEVNPAVLIPRPETESLVEAVIERVRKLWPERSSVAGVDVGTGSGVIATSLALACPQLSMTAVDISSEALELAERNARKHGARVRFVHSDLLQALITSKQKVNLIVSNPPYVAESEREQLSRTVVDYEPHVALFAKEEGLYYYRQIIGQSTDVLLKPGLIAFEVGHGQAEQVVQLILNTYPKARCQIRTDLSGIERIVLAAVDN